MTLQEQLAAKNAPKVDEAPIVEEVPPVVIEAAIETSPYKVISRRTGYQSSTRIMRPNTLGYYIPENEEEIEILEALVEQGAIIKE
jgi:hypothetical protein